MLQSVLTFIGTSNAGSTLPGEPYIARFPDNFGNLEEREIERPQVVSRYFKYSDKIDSHNKTRQGDIALEKYWRTTNCWLRLSTTFVGLNLADSWNAVRFHAADDSGFKNMPVELFAESLVYDLWNKPWDGERIHALNLVGMDDAEDGYGIEMLYQPKMNMNRHLVSREHTLVKTSRMETGTQGDRVRQKCSYNAKGCQCNGARKTMYECSNKSCMKKKCKRNCNISEGVFICQNPACLEAHVDEVCHRCHS